MQKSLACICVGALITGLSLAGCGGGGGGGSSGGSGTGLTGRWRTTAIEANGVKKPCPFDDGSNSCTNQDVTELHSDGSLVSTDVTDGKRTEIRGTWRQNGSQLIVRVTQVKIDANGDGDFNDTVADYNGDGDFDDDGERETYNIPASSQEDATTAFTLSGSEMVTTDTDNGVITKTYLRRI